MKLRAFAAALAAVFICAPGAVGGRAFATTLQCSPYASFTGAPYPGQGPYTADQDGIIAGVAGNDVLALEQGGCEKIGVAGLTLLGRIVGANMNSTSDQPFTMFVDTKKYYVPSYLIVKDCSAALTAAQGAVYDQAAKAGNKLFGTTTTPYTACTGVGTAQPVAATTAGTQVVDGISANPPILSLTTAQGAAATANVYLYGYVLGQ
jgi:hypothetical protein